MNTSVGSKTLAEHIKDGFDVLREFTSIREFSGLLQELWSLPLDQRAAFVSDVILNERELEARAIRVPADIKLLRSAFRDNRPTLFCVVRYLPEGFGWSKVTITCDNPSGPPALPYSNVAHRFHREVETQSQKYFQVVGFPLLYD